MALNDKLITYGNLSTFYDGLKLHDLADKQDKLTAGDNITITGSTISATYQTASTAEINALFA